ncbi:GntR family transcriptional regulator [Ammoniphilus sp. 3BR4]|uniref:GntR family transcriptional regulator n=1 Tax=Ammoniphilus sp. 3BR4 TaxID=3158265 RepID=UPI0034657DBC
MAQDFTSKARLTLSDMVYEEVRRRIVSLSLKPGDMIFENVVAAEFEVSRTPIREAFRKLENDELIRILPQRGARIMKLSLQKIEEAQFVRESLETSAFAKAARIWDVQDQVCQQAEARILENIEKQKKVIQEQDYFSYVRLDEEFHDSIIEVTGNQTLLSVISSMRAHLNRLRYLELQEARHEQQSTDQHVAIFNALREKDARKTVKLLQGHLRLLEGFRTHIFEKHRDLFE